MERFGVVFVFLLVSMGITIGFSWRLEMVARRNRLSDHALLTERFRTSLSNETGVVLGVYTSLDRTNAMIILHFDHVRQMSHNANNYHIFYSALGERRLNHPSANIFMFGSSGYMALLFHDPEGEGFVPQVSDIIVWHASDLVSNLGDRGAIDSFDRYDQFRIFANLGASHAIHMPLLDGDVMDVRELFTGTILVSEHDLIHEQLTLELNQMSASLARIAELRERIERQGVVVLDDPMFVVGDRVALDEDSKDGFFDVYFKHTIPGGFNFLWQGHTLQAGYIDSVIPSGTTLRDVLTEMRVARTEEGARLVVPPLTDWLYLNGDPVFPNTGVIVTDIERAIQLDIEALMNEWSAYFTLKQTHQVVTLPLLLLLEDNAVNQTIHVTVNNEGAITLWEQR